MHFFPESGFDQSAMTPVFLGVLISWFFTETFGWVFAGLVVPGYLATLFVLNPASAAIDVGEAVLTYGVARLLGEHLSWTGLTSRVFGRERFLLVLVVSVLVRLAVEGVAFAYFLPHATWANSIGLVVVPLTANACWKTGLARGTIQTGIPTLIVYALLRFVLIPHTNLSLAGFQLATENIAASFLASPKAYVVLLTGAVLAAVANVRYGWDYNGILLPALLALVVANPTKLAATLLEVLVLLTIVRVLCATTPIGRFNIEGPRRPMLFFSVDYVLRFAFAAFVGRSLPGTDVIELTGFGYLLPTLLAVKVSQRGSAALVLLPTVSVSLAAFAVGNLLGFATERLDRVASTESEPTTRSAARAPSDPALAALWVSALARPTRARATASPVLPASQLARLANTLLTNARARVPDELEVERLAGGVLLLRERFADPDRRLGAPAVLIAPAPLKQTRVVALVPTPLDMPESAALAGHLLAMDVIDAVVVGGAEEASPRVAPTMTRTYAVARSLADSGYGFIRRSGFVVTLQTATNEACHARLSARAMQEPRVLAMLQALHDPVCAFARSSDLTAGEDALIDVPVSFATAWLPPAAGSLSLATSTALAMSFDRMPPARDRPPMEDLLALRRLLLTPLLSADVSIASLALIRASAYALGYELLGPSKLPDGALAIVLRPTASTGGIALLVRLDKASGLVIEVPLGAHAALRRLALRLADSLHADAVIVGLDPEQGALGNATFAEAHAAAIWPAREPHSNIVVVREPPLGTSATAHAEVATWGGDTAAALATRSTAALHDLGIPTAEAALNLVTREQAGRSVFGDTALVALTLDAALLHRGALAMSNSTLESFGSWPVLDEECGRVALGLAATISTSNAAAPADLLDTARRVALEHSIVARRALEDALATTQSKAAIARASSGVFLVVVGRAPGTLLAGAFPLAMALPVSEAAPRSARSVEACGEALARGGTCRVVESSR